MPYLMIEYFFLFWRENIVCFKYPQISLLFKVQEDESDSGDGRGTAHSDG